jgi:hypothetical protein
VNPKCSANQAALAAGFSAATAIPISVNCTGASLLPDLLRSPSVRHGRPGINDDLGIGR